MHNFELWKVKGIFSVRLMAQAHTWTHKVKVYENLRFILLWYGFISPPLFCPGRMIQTSEHPRQDTITKFAGLSKLLLMCWHGEGKCIYPAVSTISTRTVSIYLHIYTYKYLLYSYLDPLSPESCVQATSLDWTPMPQLTEQGDQGPSWGQESVSI